MRLIIVRQENPIPIAYKFSFTRINPLCLVLPWLDSRENCLRVSINVGYRELKSGYKFPVQQDPNLSVKYVPNQQSYLFQQFISFISRRLEKTTSIGLYKLSKLWGTWRKGRYSAVNSSQICWAGHYNKCAISSLLQSTVKRPCHFILND